VSYARPGWAWVTPKPREQLSSRTVIWWILGHVHGMGLHA